MFSILAVIVVTLYKMQNIDINFSNNEKICIDSSHFTETKFYKVLNCSKIYSVCSNFCYVDVKFIIFQILLHDSHFEFSLHGMNSGIARMDDTQSRYKCCHPLYEIM